MEDRLQVGIITNTHGLKGEVKVYPTTDDPTRFEDLNEVYLKDRPLSIASVRYFKQFVILKFGGLDRIEDVEVLKGQGLFVDRDNAVPLEENEYFIADLIGLTVETDEETTLGILKDVITTAANDVYIVETSDGKEVLLPAISECILNVDVNGGKVLAHIMPGLLD